MRPSTEWREQVAADETARFDELAAVLAGIQRARAERHPMGRGLHYKARGGLLATLTVQPDLPEWARVGIFAQAGSYPAYARFSNGSGGRQPDTEPDVRALPRMLGVFGLRAGTVLGALKAGLSTRLDSVAVPTFYSALPIMWGDYAVKYSFSPIDPPASVELDTAEGYRDDLRHHLETRPLRFALRIQAFVGETKTPIEDNTVEWLAEDAPWVTVGELEISRRSSTPDAHQDLEIETARSPAVRPSSPTAPNPGTACRREDPRPAQRHSRR